LWDSDLNWSRSLLKGFWRPGGDDALLVLHRPPTTHPPTTTIPQGTFDISMTRTRAFRVLVPWCGTTQHSSRLRFSLPTPPSASSAATPPSPLPHRLPTPHDQPQAPPHTAVAPPTQAQSWYVTGCLSILDPLLTRLCYPCPALPTGTLIPPPPHPNSTSHPTRTARSRWWQGQASKGPQEGES